MPGHMSRHFIYLNISGGLDDNAFGLIKPGKALQFHKSIFRNRPIRDTDR